ncbi:unnamed protein product, partial [Mesorhabditis spiculigera]
MKTSLLLLLLFAVLSPVAAIWQDDLNCHNDAYCRNRFLSRRMYCKARSNGRKLCTPLRELSCARDEDCPEQVDYDCKNYSEGKPGICLLNY